MHDKVLRRLAKVVPSLIVQFGVQGVPHLEPRWTTLITNVAVAFTLYHLARVLCDLLNATNEAHERDEAARPPSRPIPSRAMCSWASCWSAALPWCSSWPR
jgi:miniconductance mechanosensitive channel